MTINDILKSHDLAPLPLRAWLERRHIGAPTASNPTWALEHRWEAGGEQPIICELNLHKVQFSDVFTCLALVGRLVMPYCYSADDEERTLVFLLNPADPTVWEAVDSWFQARYFSASDGVGILSSPVGSADGAALDARSIEGEELESDLLAAELLEQIKSGGLIFKSGRALRHPLYFAIVETPLIIKSLQPFDTIEWEMQSNHKANMLMLEGISD
jgi:hypothetical protein